MINQRIAAARQAAGLSMRELGKLAEVSAMSISKYESGKATPSSDVLLRLAKALNVKTEYFFRRKSVELQELEFRKHPKLPKALERRIEAHARDQVERFLDLIDHFPSAPVESFNLPAFSRASVEGLDQVEDIAQEVRRHWDLGENPISDLVDTLEQQGIRIFRTSIAEDAMFAGLAAWVDGMPLIVVSSHHPGDRQRFTMAHELGHLVLAKLALSEELDPEDAANRFAGAFLASRAAVYEKLGKNRHSLEPRELWNLKMEFGLSMTAWLHRAVDLGIISSNKYREIRRAFNTRGWDKTEPFEQLPPEPSRLMETLVLRALAEELIGESKAAELLGRSAHEFRKWRMHDSANAGRQ